MLWTFSMTREEEVSVCTIERKVVAENKMHATTSLCLYTGALVVLGTVYTSQASNMCQWPFEELSIQTIMLWYLFRLQSADDCVYSDTPLIMTHWNVDTSINTAGAPLIMTPWNVDTSINTAGTPLIMTPWNVDTLINRTLFALPKCHSVSKIRTPY